MGSDRQKMIHLHGSTEPTLEMLEAKRIQLGEIVVYHGDDEQALYIIYNKDNTDKN